jgi:hypothetical protein
MRTFMRVIRSGYLYITLGVSRYAALYWEPKMGSAKGSSMLRILEQALKAVLPPIILEIARKIH